MTAYVEFGFPPALFWSLTPREVAAHIKGARARLDREHNDRAWLAWNVAALSRAKRLPNLKTLMVRAGGKPKPRQTWQQQFAVMEQWASVSRRRAELTPMRRTSPRRAAG